MRSSTSFGVSTALSLFSLVTPGSAFWRMPCPGRIITERADPIQDPGVVAGHVHSISGGNGFDFTMTYADARSSECSSCPIKQDLSNYWTPSLYYMAENGTFESVVQSGSGDGNYGGMTVYYLQRGGPNNDNLTAYPEGFRMLAGDPFKRNYTDDFAGQAISFVCLGADPDLAYTSSLPNITCPDGLRAQVFFPSCWDGVNLDSADHKSHMAYPASVAYNDGPCPASHPVHMVSIFYEVIWNTIGYEWWNGTTQPFVFSMGDPYGYGFHGDFLNGWNVTVLQDAIDTCLNDSGLISDCPVFANDLFTTAESEACIIAPRVDEQIYGDLAALPGCNPVTWGPGEAPSSYANCPVTPLSAPLQYYTNVTGWTYLGCGSDEVDNRTFTGSTFTSTTLTVQTCMEYCSSRGYNYAGMEDADQCYCGSSLAADRAPVAGVLGNCIQTCAGNSTQYCGGANRLSMYYTANVTNTNVCPAGNGTYFTSPNGTTFEVLCGFDMGGTNIGLVYSTNAIEGCIDSCAATSGCESVSLSGTACYMKSTNISNPTVSAGIISARLISNGTSSGSSSSSSSSSSKTSSSSSSSGSSSKTSSVSTTSGTSTKTSSSSTTSASATSTSAVPLCPNLNSTTYTDPHTGINFLIQCGIDHTAGDLSMVYVSGLAGCISACANTTSCVDVSLSGAACYMKSSVGTPVYSNPGILGAKMILSSASSTTAAATVANDVVKVASTSTKTTSTSSSKTTSTSSTKTTSTSSAKTTSTSSTKSSSTAKTTTTTNTSSAKSTSTSSAKTTSTSSSAKTTSTTSAKSSSSSSSTKETTSTTAKTTSTSTAKTTAKTTSTSSVKSSSSAKTTTTSK